MSNIDEYLRLVEEVPRTERKVEELAQRLEWLEREAADAEDDLGKAKRRLEALRNRLAELEGDPEVEEEKLYRAGISNPNQIRLGF